MKYLLFLIAFCAFSNLRGQEMNPDFKVYDVRRQRLALISDIVADMDKATVLFFGEEHNDSIGHSLELMILRKMNERFPAQTALSLEMFYTDVQPELDEYLAGAISESNFIKEGRAWSNYSDYRPLIEYAKANKLRVIAANAAARYSNAVTKGGLEALRLLPRSSFTFLPPLPIDTASGRYYEKFNALLGGHNMGSMKVYQTQNFWDATMAWSIAKYLKTQRSAKVLHINGRFHSDEKLGIPAQLARYAPKIKTLNISAFSDDSFEHPDWEKFKDLGDYVIITNPEIVKNP
ncbi:ChaN family lipoprotein [Pedobacter endophyticus]|uniref:ChaN family lipoprotein n=1 Tax=Pedobacter endophyticus TaxID=2789740 RepID=A0A7S9PZA5_9SPHI|nr:ChaN family lipoprotein [Pedobacter endophyticus]QPH39740.1 ChaN family lipoprotein [Pedobacter endophyticus]